jgi:Fe2+ or Zn2+ uptake regulation protein
MPRPSPVRDALRDIFASRDHQTWSLDELRNRVRSMIGTGDYSTIFRAANVLEMEGLIQRVDLGDGLSCFEAVRAHHEHIKCDNCGRVTELPGCVVEDTFGEIEQSTGYRLKGHHLVLSGLCPDCAVSVALRT